MYLKKLKIGNVELKNNIFLAPMAGITDLPFRSICKKFGTGLTYTEMVSSKGLFYHDEKTKLLLNMKNEKRKCIQSRELQDSTLNLRAYTPLSTATVGAEDCF